MFTGKVICDSYRYYNLHIHTTLGGIEYDF